jgi:hypothetical protein
MTEGKSLFSPTLYKVIEMFLEHRAKDVLSGAIGKGRLTTVKTHILAIVLCTVLLIAVGSPLSSKIVEADVIGAQLPAPSICLRLGDNLINNRLIESAAVVGLAGTGLSLFNKPESERILASHCTPEA